MQKHELIGSAETIAGYCGMVTGIGLSLTTNNPNYLLVCGGSCLVADGLTRHFTGENVFKALYHLPKYLKMAKHF